MEHRDDGSPELVVHHPEDLGVMRDIPHRHTVGLMLDENRILSAPDFPDKLFVNLPGETDVRPLREARDSVQELGFTFIGQWTGRG